MPSKVLPSPDPGDPNGWRFFLLDPARTAILCRSWVPWWRLVLAAIVAGMLVTAMHLAGVPLPWAVLRL